MECFAVACFLMPLPRFVAPRPKHRVDSGLPMLPAAYRWDCHAVVLLSPLPMAVSVGSADISGKVCQGLLYP
jgi:hypothetical protein